MDAIVPVSFDTGTEFFRQLLDQAVGHAQIARGVNDPAVMNQIAQLLLAGQETGIDLSGEFDKAAMRELVHDLFSDFFSRQQEMQRQQRRFPEMYSWIPGVKSEELATTAVIKSLMEGLSPIHQAVLVLRSGLLGGQEVSPTAVASVLGLIDAKQVSRLRKHANDHVRAHQRELFAFERWTQRSNPAIEKRRRSLTESSSIEDMELNARTTECLKKAGIHTVGQLVKKGFIDLAAIRNLGVSYIDEIEVALEASGLHLRRI